MKQAHESKVWDFYTALLQLSICADLLTNLTQSTLFDCAERSRKISRTPNMLGLLRRLSTMHVGAPTRQGSSGGFLEISKTASDLYPFLSHQSPFDGLASMSNEHSHRKISGSSLWLDHQSWVILFLDVRSSLSFLLQLGCLHVAGRRCCL